jgi:hypothetical protein
VIKPLMIFFALAATVAAQAVTTPVGGRALIQSVSVAVPNWQPMSGNDRWEQYVHQNFTGPGSMMRVLKSASFEQLMHSPSSWPSNSRGFGERIASSYAHNLIQGSVTDGLAAALGEDTRYMPCDCSATWQRARYALRMSFFTRNSNQQIVFNFAKLAGIAGAAMALTAWRPRTRNPLEQGAIYTAPSIGLEMASSVAREFTPELKHLLRRK